MHAAQDQIKSQITTLMLSTPPPVRAQLSEALAIIGKHDFPAKWPALLPQLLEKVATGDLATVTGVLETANSIYKRYRLVITWACSLASSKGRRVVQSRWDALHAGTR